MQFDTRVAGIPCLCEVINRTSYVPMRITGSGFGDADAPEGGEFDFNILDRKGYRAKWLEKKLKPEDTERLREEHNIEVTGERFGYL